MKQEFKQRIQKYNAHQQEYIDHCRTCGKALMRKDAEYSTIKFQKPLCRLHSPYGTPPISERNLPREQANDLAKAEGMNVMTHNL